MTNYSENTLVRGLNFLAQKQASIANNLANVDTTSFKRRTAIAQTTGNRFQTLFDNQMAAVDYTERSDMGRGTLKETGHKMDIALDGPQWLRVQNNAGETFYTRNGQLSIGTDGTLTTRDGLNVLNREGAPIQLNTDGATPLDLLFSPNGTITERATGETFGPVAMVELARPEALVPVGKSLYVDPDNQVGTQAVNGLQQGFVEGSNVDSLQELVAMITVERGFSATQKALTGMNRLQQNLINNMLR